MIAPRGFPTWCPPPWTCPSEDTSVCLETSDTPLQLALVTLAWVDIFPPVTRTLGPNFHPHGSKPSGLVGTHMGDVAQIPGPAHLPIGGQLWNSPLEYGSFPSESFCLAISKKAYFFSNWLHFSFPLSKLLQQVLLSLNAFCKLKTAVLQL